MYCAGRPSGTTLAYMEPVIGLVIFAFVFHAFRRQGVVHTQ
ncbi:MAG: hypothetical protein V3V55_01885 [Rhodospirillales bacterium]